MKDNIELVVNFRDNEFMSYSDYLKIIFIPQIKNYKEITLKDGRVISIDEYVNNILPKYVNLYNGDVFLILENTTSILKEDKENDFEIVPIQEEIKTSDDIIIVKEDNYGIVRKIEEKEKKNYEKLLEEANNLFDTFKNTRQYHDFDIIHLVSLYESILDDINADKDSFTDIKEYYKLIHLIKNKIMK